MTFMVKSLQRESAPTIAIALDRGRREADFSEHDRFMLNLLRPHVMTAYANAETVGALRRTAPTPGGAPETRRREIIVLRASGRHLISPRAAYWFGHYFANGPGTSDGLPGELEGWVRRQAVRVGRGPSLAEPPAPLVVDGNDTRLIVRLIPDTPNDLLIVEEERTKVDYAALQRLGLTPREAEVLHWVGEGKTNSEIGTILHTRPRTVPSPSAGPTYFARSTQPSPRRRAAQLEIPRSRSASALNVSLHTPRAAPSLGPRLARNLARHLAGARRV
jgi:hypothetical protein